uniref:TauD domain-containing protein n=1 Tax=Ascaris lumbricoides TaxID=6252 RepID=A0A0M3ICS6_ASCLU
MIQQKTLIHVVCIATHNGHAMTRRNDVMVIMWLISRGPFFTTNFTQSQQSQLPQPADPTRQFDTLSAPLAQFVYDPETNLTFEARYRRHEDVFAVDGATLDDATRVRLLLQKLDTPTYERYANYILPRDPRNVNFADTITLHTDLFGPQQSLLNARYACMKLRKEGKSRVRQLLTRDVHRGSV